MLIFLVFNHNIKGVLHLISPFIEFLSQQHSPHSNSLPKHFGRIERYFVVLAVVVVVVVPLMVVVVCLLSFFLFKFFLRAYPQSFPYSQISPESEKEGDPD